LVVFVPLSKAHHPSKPVSVIFYILRHPRASPDAPPTLPQFRRRSVVYTYVRTY
jgi:hypothetical protein